MRRRNETLGERHGQGRIVEPDQTESLCRSPGRRGSYAADQCRRLRRTVRIPPHSSIPGSPTFHSSGVRNRQAFGRPEAWPPLPCVGSYRKSEVGSLTSEVWIYADFVRPLSFKHLNSHFRPH